MASARTGRGRPVGPRLPRDDEERLRAAVRDAVKRRVVPSVKALAAVIHVAPGTLYLFMRGGGLTRRVAAAVASGVGVEGYGYGDALAVSEAPAREIVRYNLDDVATPALAEGCQLVRVTRAARANWVPERLSLRPTRFEVARLVEAFALLREVPDGLTLADILRAEDAYRQARAIPASASTRHWVKMHGTIIPRLPGKDAADGSADPEDR